MHVYVVFAHPSRHSFSGEVLDAFTRGLLDAGHSFELGDLYDMGFECEMSADEYLRETRMDTDSPIPEDVRAEQSKIDKANALAFIYPIWWSDCPAKLKGWFDRVLTYGYAYFYGEDQERSTSIDIDKALILCPAGHTVEHLEEIGIAYSMRHVMLDDRLLGVGVRQARMEILGGMTGSDSALRKLHLESVYQLGRDF